MHTLTLWHLYTLILFPNYNSNQDGHTKQTPQSLDDKCSGLITTEVHHRQNHIIQAWMMLLTAR